MSIPMSAPMKITWVLQDRDCYGVTRRETQGVTFLHFFSEHLKPNALHATCCSRETTFDDIVGEADSLKNLCTFVGLKSGDAHFRHHLEHALSDAFLVCGNDVSVIVDMLSVFQVSVPTSVPQSLKS